MATMSEQEKIQTRWLAVFAQSLQREPVHVMTATQEGATRHADFFARVGDGLVEVAQLPVAGSDSVILAAYRTEVVVGPISVFIANFDRGLRVECRIALVEGEPPAAARSMLSGYGSVRRLS
jgi:hypothetical protein